MKHMSLRTLMLYACAFLFACLLLSGAPRLIGTAQEEEVSMQLPVKIAYLCSAPSGAPDVQHSWEEQPRYEKRAGDARIAASECVGDPTITLKRDANGNILFHKSYIKTVYQAFSLGDGFA